MLKERFPEITHQIPEGIPVALPHRANGRSHTARTYRGSPPPSLEWRAFTPLQFVLQVESKASQCTVSDIRRLLDALRIPAQLPPEVQVDLRSEITTFSNTEGKTRSFALISAPVSDAELLQLIEQLNRLKGNETGDVILGGATPNFLMSAVNLGGSPTGGPGGKPTQVKAITHPNTQQVNESKKWRFNLPEDSWGNGMTVNVAILDTLPSLHDLAHAYIAEELKEAPDKHELIMELLNPNGLIEFHPASYKDLVEMGDYRVKGQEYKMADHGLFAAGMIRAIAPCARLHLIEVMGTYGVGSVDSFIKGLGKLQRLISSSPQGEAWVVNCSFTFVLNEQPEMFAEFMRQATALFEFLEKTKDHKVCVIAAAGNDGHPDLASPSAAATRQPPRFPAASRTVIGVAALKKGPNTSPASYSNYAGLQPGEGFSVLGGEEGENQGVLGIYLGDVPTRREFFNGKPIWWHEVNESGWAWWAGTSFATAMMSGMAAAILSTPSATTADSAGHSAADYVKNVLRPLATTVEYDQIIMVSQP